MVEVLSPLSKELPHPILLAPFNAVDYARFQPHQVFARERKTAGLHSEDSSSDHNKGPGAAPVRNKNQVNKPAAPESDKQRDAATPHLQEK